MMKKNNDVIKGILMITQIGLTMMVPIFLCVFIGYQLDRHFQTGFWLIIFLILGVMAAFRNVYVLTKGFYAKDKSKEDAELQYFESLKQEGRRVRQSASMENDKTEQESKNNIKKGRKS